MLVEFKFKNYRSFRDEATLSMEATGLGAFKDSLISFATMKLLPSVAIYGKNGGGKSNVIRAFWLAVQFIKNAQRTQHENAEIPVTPNALNDYSKEEPTEFEFIYALEGVKYWYSFSATKEKVCRESLYHAPKGQKALVFDRKDQTFHFTEEKAKRNLIRETVAPNQLFFSVACTMNDKACVNAMKWFRESIYFSRDYSDLPKQLLDYCNDETMLQAISDYAKAVDVGIESMQFEIDRKEIKDDVSFPGNTPASVKTALTQFLYDLSEPSNYAERRLKMNAVKAISNHQGVNANGETLLYPLELAEESDGTRKLMSIAPAIASVLGHGGVLVIDDIERNLHPMLVDFVVAKFQNKNSNPNGAQLFFTTHDTELMNLEILRKDQLYFADKSRQDGASELYSISEFGTRTTENIRKGYLLGKYGATPDIEIEGLG